MTSYESPLLTKI